MGKSFSLASGLYPLGHDVENSRIWTNARWLQAEVDPMSTTKGPIEPSIRAIVASLIENVQQAVKGSDGATVIASPYLTGDLAQVVIRDVLPANVTVITTFRAENFASGASSLGTLKALIAHGVTLRHSEDLHAKIIATPDTCFVGSHNLTTGALRNKEATLATSDSTVVCFINDTLRGWITSSSSITPQMIEDMEARVRPLASSYDDLRRAAADVDEAVKGAEEKRRNQERRRLEEERLEKQRRTTSEALLRAREAHSWLRKEIQSLPSSQKVHLTLQRIVNESGIAHDTLMARAGVDLTTWWLDLERVDLTKRQRYLLIMPETGRLGWPALNWTRLTRFGTDLAPRKTSVVALGENWNVVEVTLNQSLETLNSWNVSFELRCRGLTFDVRMLFNLEGLKVVGVEPRSTSGPADLLARQLASNDRRLNRQLKEILIDPFRYKANSRGVSADRFCEGLSDSFVLSLKLQGFQKFFCLESN